MAVSKVIVNDVTRVDLTQDTVAPEYLVTDYTAHNHMGQAIVGTAVADNDFTITLTKVNDVWAPDCSFAEAQAAYNAGKTLIWEATSDASVAVFGWSYAEFDMSEGFYYSVAESFSEQTPGSYKFPHGTRFYQNHYWTSAGIEAPDIEIQYELSEADASAADVRSGKWFFNQSGLQTGTMPNGSATTPATTITANPSISVSSSGLITATASASQSVTPTVSAGYVSNGTSGTVTVSGSDTLQLSVQGSKTITPSTSSQTAVAAGKYTTGTVTVAAMPTGTAGTPTATKGTVSDHSVTITPSVTNTTGYITGGTKTGTAVTVTAAELESGTKTITENGTGISVSGYSAVDVNVSQTYTATISGTTGSKTFSYVRHVASDQKYYTDGDTFTYQSGQTLYCRIRSQNIGGGELIIDGTMIDSAYPQGQDTARTIQYNYTLPECDIEIEFGTGASNVDRITITTHPPVTAVPQTVTQNGTYTAPSGTAYSPVVVDVSGSSTIVEEKDVNFIDYDGTIVYSYTASEFANLTALPNNPGHAGLTAQGWNWTLADAQAYVATYGELTIGQMYVTTSGATEIDITLAESTALSPILFFNVNGTATIDWGDNSATNTVTGTSLSTRIFTQHTYSQIGSYTISIVVNSGTVQFINSSSSNAGLFSFMETPQPENCYTNSVTAIRLGTSISLGLAAFRSLRSLKSITIPTGLTTSQYAFEYCSSLSGLTLPSGITTAASYCLRYCFALSRLSLPSSLTTANTYAFSACYALKRISIPSNVTSIDTNLLRNNYSLASVIVPDDITSIPNYAFSDLRSITSLTIPSGVTSIGASVFNNCYSMQFYHFLSTTPPTLSTNNFTNIRSDAKIYVPYSADHSVLNAYKTATNWSAVADYMEEE